MIILSLSVAIGTLASAASIFNAYRRRNGRSALLAAVVVVATLFPIVLLLAGQDVVNRTTETNVGWILQGFTLVLSVLVMLLVVSVMRLPQFTIGRTTARRQLGNTNRLFQHSLDRSQTGIVGYRRGGGFTYLNGAACEMLGYCQSQWESIDQCRAGTGFKLFREDDFWTRIRGGHAVSFETEVRRNDDTLASVTLVATYLHYEGEEYVFAFITGVDERKQDVQSRRRNEELLEATNRLANVGGWELDLESMELLWTAQTCRIHEVSTDYRPELASAITYYAPEARGVIQAAVEEAIQNGSSWDVELPLITAKGRHRWVRAQGAADIVDGKPVRLHGAFQDVTERRLVEDALKHRLEFEAILARTSSAFINLPAREIAEGIDSCLAPLGRFLQADRVLVEEFSQDQSMLLLTHQWSSNGGDNGGGDSNVPVSSDIELSELPWARDSWLRGETIVAPRISAVPAEAVADGKWIKAINVQAFVSSPLVINGKNAGAVSFCWEKEQPDWSNDFVKQVKLVGEVLANALTRKRNDEALQASEQKYRRLYERTPAMLHSVDTEGKIITVSDHWLQSLGYQRSEVIGKSILDFLTPESRHFAEHVCIPEFQQSNVLKDGELQVVKKDGTVIETLLSAIAERDATGKMVGSLVVVIDVTERKRAQEQSRKHRDVLAHMTRLSTMGELVAGIAHEVKQPLYAITNFAAATAASLGNFNPTQPPDAKSLEELKEWTRAVRRASKSASEIINRLREFARKDESRREEIRVETVIEDSINLVAFEARQCQVAVETKLTDRSMTIFADRIQCEQVIVNLLHNAYEALTECEHPRRVIVRADLVDDQVELQVIDNGPGIPAEQQGKLFEAFYTTKSSGMGMGLAISQTIVEDHGGRLWGSVNALGGATFHLTLPCKDPASVAC